MREPVHLFQVLSPSTKKTTIEDQDHPQNILTFSSLTQLQPHWKLCFVCSFPSLPFWEIQDPPGTARSEKPRCLQDREMNTIETPGKQDETPENYQLSCPIGSMYRIFTYIWLIFMVNVGKYTIHGSYGCLNMLWGLQLESSCLFMMFIVDFSKLHPWKTKISPETLCLGSMIFVLLKWFLFRVKTC